MLIVSKTSATKSSNGENPQEGGENLEDFLAEVLEMPTVNLYAHGSRLARRRENPKEGGETSRACVSTCSARSFPPGEVFRVFRHHHPDCSAPGEPRRPNETFQSEFLNAVKLAALHSHPVTMPERNPPTSGGRDFRPPPAPSSTPPKIAMLTPPALRVLTGSGRTDVGLWPTHPGASASSVAGGAAARETDLRRSPSRDLRDFV